MQKDRRTIICFSHLAWDRNLFQRPQQLMLRFSKRFNVLYVSGYSFRQFFIDLFHREKPHSYHVTDTLAVYSPFALPTMQKHFSIIIHLNKMLSSFLIKRRLKKLKFNNPILWIYHPRYVDTIGKFKEGLIVYDCMDDFTSLLSDYEDRGRNTGDEEVLLKKGSLSMYSHRLLR
jgi:teichuronic acid biosynthesis glycosyltransferase TuaH